MPTQVSDAAGQLLALIVVRLVSVFIALFRSDLPIRSRLFIGWFGPRGIGTLVLGLLMVGRGEIQQADMITQAVVVTVTLSLVVHSLTTPLGIRLWPAHVPQKAA
jgi:NhaP-type Na+/H+ or K+/H+ antiporter